MARLFRWVCALVCLVAATAVAPTVAIPTVTCTAEPAGVTCVNNGHMPMHMSLALISWKGLNPPCLDDGTCTTPIVILPGGAPTVVASISDGSDFTSSINYWSHTIREGTGPPDPGLRMAYRPPYQRLATVTQSFLDCIPSHCGGIYGHAIDFALPRFELIVAARPGIVVAIVDGHGEGGSCMNNGAFDPSAFPGRVANVVRVLHSDGSWATYVHLLAGTMGHLTLGGAVGYGAVLAQNGNSGCSEGPHLHWSVHAARVPETLGELVNEAGTKAFSPPVFSSGSLGWDEVQFEFPCSPSIGQLMIGMTLGGTLQDVAACPGPVGPLCSTCVHDGSEMCILTDRGSDGLLHEACCRNDHTFPVAISIQTSADPMHELDLSSPAIMQPGETMVLAIVNKVGGGAISFYAWSSDLTGAAICAGSGATYISGFPTLPPTDPPTNPPPTTSPSTIRPTEIGVTVPPPAFQPTNLILVPTTVAPPTSTAASYLAAVGVLPGGIVEFPASTRGRLLTLSLAIPSAPDVVAIPLAWCYDGNGYEAASSGIRSVSDADEIVRALVERCTAGTSCFVALPAGSIVGPTWSGAPGAALVFRFDSYGDTTGLATGRGYNVTDMVAAKFLTQTSFGPTRAEIATLSAALSAAAATASNGNDGSEHALLEVLQDHLQAQMMAIQATSHREYYRKRTNPRINPGEGHYAGGVTFPCSSGSRWQRYAFDKTDKGSSVSFQLVCAPNGDTEVEIRVSGELRTRVPREWSFNRYMMNERNVGRAGAYGGTCTCPDGTAWLVMPTDTAHACCKDIHRQIATRTP